MSSSYKNTTVDITVNTNLADEVHHGDTKDSDTTTIDLKKDAGTTSKDTKNCDERPGIGPRQISVISTDHHRGHTKPSSNDQVDDATANKSVETKCDESRVTSSTYDYCRDCLSHDAEPQERGLVDIRGRLDIRGTIGTPPIPAYPSRDSLTLAQLYHSSRRSRHDSPRRGLINSDLVPSKNLPAPPLSMDDGRQHISHDTSAVVQQQERNNSFEPEWSFHLASSVFYDSCSSIGSAESEEILDQESATAACEQLFGGDGIIEQQSKRRRTSPGE